MRTQLASYLQEGLRAEYAALTAWRQALPAAARVLGVEGFDQNARLRRFFVLDHGGTADEHDITAWDTARIVHYAGLAWAAGWLAEHEAWQYASQAAQLARAAYASWDAYGRGFVYGRWYWQGYWNADMTTAAQGGAPDSNGYNPPSLFGVQVGAPYFHAGNARTLEELFSPTFGAHWKALTKNANFLVQNGDVAKLVAYLLSIDADKPDLAIPVTGAQGGNFCAP